jgi:NAD(P)-dependent dehydrogenase (short-subunit alcohol dehydrogenase family)
VSVLESFSLNGKVAVVTGGGGLYGTQITEALAEAGAHTFIASRDLGKLQRQAESLRARELNVEALSLDQASEESVQHALRTILERCPGVDILINNAVLRTMADWNSSVDDFARSMQVNATGMFIITRTFGNHMAERRRGGSIVNIGSIQGMVGPDFTLYEGLDWGAPPDYFFHKGGLLQLTRFAAAKLGPHGVRVNCLSPGGFYTEQDDRFVRRYNGRTFLNRMANESDLKGAVVFLASDASAYITGANLPVDGGYTAK